MKNIYLFTSSIFSPTKYPKRVKIVTQIPAPKEVKKQNLGKFILENPAGKETNCLITGKSLPVKVVISPCFLKYLSDLIKPFFPMKNIFPYFKINLFTAFLPICRAIK